MLKTKQKTSFLIEIRTKFFQTGYASGGCVPKVELLGNGRGREQGNWLTYCPKWIAMEELPEAKSNKRITERSFPQYFVVGDVEYNIKDLIKNAQDPKYKPLYDELIDLRKLLFSFRSIYYNDIFPDVKLNIKNRNSELAKPLIRLFISSNTNTNSERQKEMSKKVENEIIEALSIFLKERNETRKSSLESKLYDSIRNLIKDKKFIGTDTNDIDKDQNENFIYQFTNEDIISKVKQVLNSHEIPLRPESFYSDEFGMLSIRKIISIYKSKFNAKRIKTSGDNSKRGLQFSKEILDQSSKHYDVPDNIKICSDNEIEDIKRDNTNSDKQNNTRGASLASLATHSEDIPTSNNEKSSTKINIDNKNNIETTNNEHHQNKNNQEKVDNVFSQNNNTPSKSVACVAYDANHELDKNNEHTKNTDSIPYNDQSESKNNVIKIIRLSPKKNSNIIVINEDKKNNNSQNICSDQDIHLPRIPCQYCNYSHFNDIDLSLHYLEEHRYKLLNLGMRGSLEYKADYLIRMTKKEMYLNSMEFKEDYLDVSKEYDY